MRCPLQLTSDYIDRDIFMADLKEEVASLDLSPLYESQVDVLPISMEEPSSDYHQMPAQLAELKAGLFPQDDGVVCLNSIQAPSLGETSHESGEQRMRREKKLEIATKFAQMLTASDCRPVFCNVLELEDPDSDQMEEGVESMPDFAPQQLGLLLTTEEPETAASDMLIQRMEMDEGLTPQDRSIDLKIR